MQIIVDGSEVASEIGSKIQSGLLACDESETSRIEKLESVSVFEKKAIMLLQSNADGSCEVSSARKFLKVLSSDPTIVGDSRVIILLLGGARCYNSASQTKDEVYRQGRKVIKALSNAGATVFEKVELHYELENIEAAVNQILDSYSKMVNEVEKERAEHKRDSPRVLSLLSASTEIICRLGCAHLLVGRSHGCDDPALAATLPIMTAPYVDPNTSSQEIDDCIRVHLAASGPVYHIRNKEVIDLAPDFILTQEQCRICAVTKEDVDAVCSALPVGSTNVITIKPERLEDIWGDIDTIATALDVAERGKRLVTYLQNKMKTVTELSVSVAQGHRPKVAHIEWLAPLMGSGYWIAQCVEAASCDLICGTVGGHSPVLSSMEELKAAECIILAPCGFGIERTHHELVSLGLLERKEWLDLPAVKKGRVYCADGNRSFNRSSAASVSTTAEMVAEMAFEHSLCGLFGHHGAAHGWVRLSELELFCSREGATPVHKRVDVAPPMARPSAASRNVDLSQAVESADYCAHVHKQVLALFCGKEEEVWELNSDANKKRLGSCGEFMALVKSHPSFKCLMEPEQYEIHSIKPSDFSAEGDKRTVDVSLAEIEAKKVLGTVFLFDLALDLSGQWKTEGVRLGC
jgi:iron complex transport system substrate-binding protein